MFSQMLILQEIKLVESNGNLVVTDLVRHNVDSPVLVVPLHFVGSM